MGMVVRTNIMAMNANRSLGANNSTVSKNLEKLSSGFRINRAGDDASGLAISEKMKAQIKGLETASSNAQDGISLIQTAEGALTEVHNMLNRMVELAGKSANGTMDSTVDRQALQNEITSLIGEIDRIAEGTNFNGIQLLDGSMGAGKGAITTGAVHAKTENIKNGTTTTAASFEIDLDTLAATKGGELKFTIDSKVITINVADGDSAANIAEKLADAYNEQADSDLISDGTVGKFYMEATGTKVKLTAEKAGATTDFMKDKLVKVESTTAANTGTVTKGEKFEINFSGLTNLAAKDTIKIGTKTFTIGTADGQVTAGSNINETVANLVEAINKNPTMKNKYKASAEGGKLVLEAKKDGVPAIGDPTITIDTANQATNKDSGLAKTIRVPKNDSGLTLQIGDTGADFNQMTVQIEDMSSKGLNIKDINITTKDSAKEALKLLRGDLAEGGKNKGAINLVSENRARMGALQNRLEYTINNLDVAAENMSAANSRIRDTDMAKQMMAYTQSNVLTQAAQAMLAQANQQPQSVLQLLQ